MPEPFRLIISVTGRGKIRYDALPQLITIRATADFTNNNESQNGSIQKFRSIYSAPRQLSTTGTHIQQERDSDVTDF